MSKLNPAGNALVYSTFLGAEGFEKAGDIDVDDLGRAFVIGTTSSKEFPTTADAVQRERGLPDNAFVAILQPSGSSIFFSTYFGSRTEGRDVGLLRLFGLTPSSYRLSRGGAFSKYRDGQADNRQDRKAHQCILGTVPRCDRQCAVI